jgi:hypothetical protein
MIPLHTKKIEILLLCEIETQQFEKDEKLKEKINIPVSYQTSSFAPPNI